MAQTVTPYIALSGPTISSQPTKIANQLVSGGGRMRVLGRRARLRECEVRAGVQDCVPAGDKEVASQ
jgi:hypothetical protein